MSKGLFVVIVLFVDFPLVIYTISDRILNTESINSDPDFQIYCEGIR